MLDVRYFPFIYLSFYPSIFLFLINVHINIYIFLILSLTLIWLIKIIITSLIQFNHLLTFIPSLYIWHKFMMKSFYFNMASRLSFFYSFVLSIYPIFNIVHCEQFWSEDLVSCFLSSYSFSCKNIYVYHVKLGVP